MAKIIFNNKNYNINDSALAPAMAALEEHLEFMVSGGDVVWLTGDTATITDGVAQFASVGYLVDNRTRKIHENAVIEVVVDGVVITCPLDGVTTSGLYTTIGTYNGFEIQIGAWSINSKTKLYAPKVNVPNNTTSVTYKYPSIEE